MPGKLTAAEAKLWGLCSEVYAPDELMVQVRKIAEEIAKVPFSQIDLLTYVWIHMCI